MVMTPEQIAKPGTEHAHQSALFCWINSEGCRVWPSLQWAHAIPNGGDRNPAVAGRLKAEGVKAGVFDIFVPVARGRWHGLYVEMKKPGRERETDKGISDAQRRFGLAMHEQGYYTTVNYSWLTARVVICSYMQGEL